MPQHTQRNNNEKMSTYYIRTDAGSGEVEDGGWCFIEVDGERVVEIGSDR